MLKLRHGQTYINVGNGHIKIVGKCVFCRAIHTLTASELGVITWLNGELIQRALPYLDADDREFLISGICPSCFDKAFSNDV